METTSTIQKKLRPMIDLVDELRENGVNHYISLPSIVVVGDQSSGKSSVIEALSGIDLPRGIGCVTRCPIIIRMVKSFDKKYEILFGDKQEAVKDPKQLSQLILDEQDRKTKTKKGISDTPINITVYSPDVYDLTLIDLPGITRVPIDDQPKDIYEKIKEMISKYIKERSKSHTSMMRRESVQWVF
jgi:interferon-induced GTP-binding protein Mx1